MNKPIHTQSVAAIFLCLFSAQAFGLSPAYEPLPLNAIKPRGWIYNQITNDATTGMAGNFLKFRPQCGSGTWVNKDGSDGAAEMGGNWLDGYARMAYLTGVPGAPTRFSMRVRMSRIIAGARPKWLFCSLCWTAASTACSMAGSTK